MMRTGAAGVVPQFCQIAPALIEAAGTYQAAFLAQSLHQPEGLTTPSTTWQEFGAWNRRQLSHWWESLGVL
jgi:hypothetical protein